MKEKETSFTAGGNVSGAAVIENSLEDPQN